MRIGGAVNWGKIHSVRPTDPATSPCHRSALCQRCMLRAPVGWAPLLMQSLAKCADCSHGVFPTLKP